VELEVIFHSSLEIVQLFGDCFFTIAGFGLNLSKNAH
jgi:hypothetical protein